MPRASRTDTQTRYLCTCTPCAASIVPQYHTTATINDHVRQSARIQANQLRHQNATGSRIPGPRERAHGQALVEEDNREDWVQAASRLEECAEGADLGVDGAEVADGDQVRYLLHDALSDPGERKNNVFDNSGVFLDNDDTGGALPRAHASLPPSPGPPDYLLDQHLPAYDAPGLQWRFSRTPTPVASPPPMLDIPDDRSDGGVSYLGPSRSPSPDGLSRPPTPARSDDHDPDAVDVREDPLYVDIETLFDQILEDEEDDLAGGLPTAYSYETGRPRALLEHSLVRNAYMHVYLASAVHGATKELCKHLLDGFHTQLAALPQITGFTVPDLNNMARTLRTVERRLGVDPDRYITYYFTCDTCWAHHHPRTLYSLGSHLCMERECPGLLFKYKKNSEGKTKRIPVKVIPTTALIDSIVRMAARPGKLDDWDKWRGDNDLPGPVPPAEHDDWKGWEDPNYHMFDMMDGWGWRCIAAGLERRRGGEWGVEDIDVQDVQQRFVALPNGLVLQINIDWYGALKCGIMALIPLIARMIRFRATKRGGYSVGAVYVTICNNPRSVRLRREETLLYCVIPGPNEPSTAQLNRLLGPLHVELEKLYNGGHCIFQSGHCANMKL